MVSINYSFNVKSHGPSVIDRRFCRNCVRLITEEGLVAIGLLYDLTRVNSEHTLNEKFL